MNVEKPNLRGGIPHDHRTLVEGCYRCDLNRDEPHRYKKPTMRTAALCVICGNEKEHPIHA